MRLVLSGDAEVNEPHISVGSYDDVVRFDVPVDDGRVHPVELVQQGQKLQSHLTAACLVTGAGAVQITGERLPGQVAADQIDGLFLPEAVGRKRHTARQSGVELGEQPELLLQVLAPLPGNLEHIGSLVAPAAEEPHAAAFPLRQTGLRPVHQGDAVRQGQTVHHLLVVLTKILGAAHRSPPSPRERSSSSVSSRVRWWVSP